MTMAESDNMRPPQPLLSHSGGNLEEIRSYTIVSPSIIIVLVGQSLNVKHNEKNVHVLHLGLLIIPQPYSKK